MKENEKKEDNTFQQMIMIGLLLVTVWVTKNSDRIKIWFFDHIGTLILIALGVIALAIKFFQWRWKKKNPDLYKREIAVQSLERRGLNHSRFSSGTSGLQSASSAVAPSSNAKTIYIGSTLKDKRKIFLKSSERSGHVQIVGATGRGKTQSVILPWYWQDVKNGDSPILIDGKGDQELAEIIWDKFLTLPEGRRKYLRIFDLNSETSCTINPLEGGSPQEACDRLISSLEFESVYYKNMQQAGVLLCLEVFRYCHEDFTLKGIYQNLSDPTKLSDLLRGRDNIPEEISFELAKLLKMSGREREEIFSGILSQLRPFASGSLGKLTNGHEYGAEHLSLTGFVQNELGISYGHKAAIILLPTMQYQKSAKILGKMILQTCAWATAKKRQSAFCAIYMDEFSSFVYEGFEQFLNKARSSGVSLHISHQSVGDLEAVSESFAKVVNVNTNIKCLLGLNDPDTADYFARHLGTNTRTKLTERGERGSFGDTRRTGDMSMRDVEEYKIHPNKLKHYSQGEGVLSMIVNGIPLAEEVQFERIGS